MIEYQDDEMITVYKFLKVERQKLQDKEMIINSESKYIYSVTELRILK